jgi:hypothetical protein
MALARLTIRKNPAPAVQREAEEDWGPDDEESDRLAGWVLHSLSAQGLEGTCCLWIEPVATQILSDRHNAANLVENTHL